MTDHYTEANRLIDGLHNLEGHNADFDMALAQVHATLALAEHARISNLIALASALPALSEWTDGPETAAREAAYSLIESKFISPDDEMPVIDSEIARALRIETP